MYLFATCICISLVKCLLTCLALPLFHWIVGRLLFILDTSPLSDKCSASIFFQLVACLFILLAVSFKEQKFFILMKFSLSVFSFMDLFWCVLPKKSLPNQSHKGFLMCSHLDFLVLGFTFKSLILLSNFCLWQGVG